MYLSRGREREAEERRREDRVKRGTGGGREGGSARSSPGDTELSSY